MAEKIKDGWVYGDVKDPELKTHPCLVPYNELPVEQKTKDTLFINIVHAVVKAIPQDMLQENLVRINPGEEPPRYIKEIEPSQELVDAVSALCAFDETSAHTWTTMPPMNTDPGSSDPAKE